MYVALTAMVENPHKLHRPLGGPAAGITELAGKNNRYCSNNSVTKFVLLSLLKKSRIH